MRENPYRVLGTGIAALRGRQGDLSRLLHHLQKTTPDHVSVVGPRYIGKTVLLNAIAAYFAGGRNPFDACVYWDMRHGAPDSDASFYRQFAHQLTGPVTSIDRGIGAALSGHDSGTFDNLRLVFETLAEEHKKILVILDGLDTVLPIPALTRNLWDNLRSLAELSSLRFVIGSRRRLGELCAPDSKTSPFWNLFPSFLSLGALKDEDWNDLLEPFKERKVSFQPGAQTELANWSGGAPVLASFLCRRLWEAIQDSEAVNPQYINRLAAGSFDEAQDLLLALWNDCAEEERGDIAELAQDRLLKPSELPPQRLRTLRQRGFVQEKGDVVSCSCRLMKQYAREHGARSSELRRLFGDPQSFDANIKGLLELRFGQLENTDETMGDYAGAAIHSLDKPHLVVSQIRGLANRALDLIWESELPDRKIPQEWTSAWKQLDREGNRAERDPPEGTVPSQRGRQCYLLNLMTDSRKAGTTRVSRSTYFLLNHLQSVGDFGQHMQGETVPLRFGAAICFAAIELCEQLARDLRA